MKKLLAGNCDINNIFNLVDPTKYLESTFEAEVVTALNCLLPEYLCGIFSGTFVLEGERRSADLAIVHKSLSHWFVIEVEIMGHSLDQHILPQVRCFRYGEPDDSCVTSLCRCFNSLSVDEARRILTHVPRYVAVIGNLYSSDWLLALKALDVQLLILSVYECFDGKKAYELQGTLIARRESLGFATYSAINDALRISKHCGLPEGEIQIIDQFGSVSTWISRANAESLWISKKRGATLLEHNSYVQILRTYEGKISIHPSKR